MTELIAHILVHPPTGKEALCGGYGRCRWCTALDQKVWRYEEWRLRTTVADARKTLLKALNRDDTADLWWGEPSAWGNTRRQLRWTLEQLASEYRLREAAQNG